MARWTDRSFYRDAGARTRFTEIDQSYLKFTVAIGTTLRKVGQGKYLQPKSFLNYIRRPQDGTESTATTDDDRRREAGSLDRLCSTILRGVKGAKRSCTGSTVLREAIIRRQATPHASAR